MSQPAPTPEPQADENGWYDCQVCGRRRHTSDRCGCGDGDPGRLAPPEGWNPELTAGSRPRLPLMGRPAPAPPAPPADRAEPSE